MIKKVIHFFKKEKKLLNNKDYTIVSLFDFHSFIKYILFKPSIPDMWRGRAFCLFELIIDLMIKLNMSIKDIHRIYDLDSFVKYTYSISDNDPQIEYLNLLPGYGTDNYIAKQQFIYLMMQINSAVDEFMILMDNDMILYHPKPPFIKHSWMDHHLFSIIKKDFKDGFSIVDIIKQVANLTDDNKKEQYYTYLHFLYQNIYQYKSLYDKI